MLAATVGAPELLIVLAIVLLVFGSKKLPELARGLASAAREFRQGAEEEEADEAEHDPGR